MSVQVALKSVFTLGQNKQLGQLLDEAEQEGVVGVDVDSVAVPTHTP